MKNKKKAVTLAIGDGANDVGMIKGNSQTSDRVTIFFLLFPQLLILVWGSVDRKDSKQSWPVTIPLDSSGTHMYMYCICLCSTCTCRHVSVLIYMHMCIVCGSLGAGT